MPQIYPKGLQPQEFGERFRGHRDHVALRRRCRALAIGHPIGHEPATLLYKAGLDYAIAKGWLVLHESGTYVRFTEAGAALFA